MMTFVGQTSRTAIVLGRLHHAVSGSGAGGMAAIGYQTRRDIWPSCSQCLYTSSNKVKAYQPSSHGNIASSRWDRMFLPSTNLTCRAPCMSLEQCVLQTCSRTFSVSGASSALTRSSTALPDDKPGIVTRMLDSVGLTGKLRYNRFKIRVAGLNMYKACADGYKFETFFRACNMPDTMFSWFLIMELHVWMCMVRLKQEGREGKYLTHFLILSMWHDVQERGKVMGISSVKMKESLSKMVEQFNGALFAYDEGLMSNDKVLAAALWRNLFHRDCEDPEQLANMVGYVRQQIQYLDTLDSGKLLQVGRIKWQPFKGTLPQSDAPLPKAATVDQELDIPEVDKVPAH